MSSPERIMTFNVMAEAELACFTAQEFKTDRFSYPVPTPGALEGMLKQIFWKPPIEYRIKKIAVCRKPKYRNIKRNEIKDKAKATNYTTGISVKDSRTQRNTGYLVNPKYIIQVDAFLLPNRVERDLASGVNIKNKYREIIKRRFMEQSEFRTPFLGCSECIADVTWIDNFEKAICENMDEEMKISGNIDYGFMRCRMKFRNGGHPDNNNWDNPVWNEAADPTFYHALMKNGIITVEEA